MSELEEKLGSLLNNPQMMQQILSMAQAMGAQQTPPEAPPPSGPTQPMPTTDPALLRSLAGIAGQSGVDSNQQALLHALSPYLSHDRVGKLERAMRAAKMANAASAFFNAGGLQLFGGR